MWSAQWAVRANCRGTGVVVLDHFPPNPEISNLRHLFAILYERIRALSQGQKVLVGTIHSAQKAAEVAGQGDDQYGYGFKSQPKSREGIFLLALS